MARYEGIDISLMPLDALDQKVGSSSDLQGKLLVTVVLGAGTDPPFSGASLVRFDRQPVPDLRFVEDV